MENKTKKTFAFLWAKDFEIRSRESVIIHLERLDYS
jgi:hypothetical protein